MCSALCRLGCHKEFASRRMAAAFRKATMSPFGADDEIGMLNLDRRAPRVTRS